MDSVNQPPELDTSALASDYVRRIQAACPEHLPLAMRVLDRLEPARWELEWHLPWWLGHDMGLDPAVSRELVLSNVLGLASIRLRDDLLDGDLDEYDSSAALALSGALYEAAIETYRAHFPTGSDLWPEIALRMTEWRTATGDNAAPPGADAEDSQAVARHLARRGAPLRISAFAVCLLAARTDVYPRLGRCLDHALAAMVLFDHLCDWQDDLAAGRWNAFVARTTSSAQTSEHLARNRAAVAAAMMARDAVATHFGRINVELAEARSFAAQADLPGLATHLADIAAQMDEHAEKVQGQYRKLGDGAVAILRGKSRPGAVDIAESARLATA
jgi:hypothetical protein